MKMIIEVQNGVVQNIVATEEVSVHLIDHDNLADSNGVGRKELVSDTRQAQQPDLICDEEIFAETLDDTLDPYEN